MPDPYAVGEYVGERVTLFRARGLIIQLLKALQDVMATSFPKNQGKVQFDTVVRMVEDFVDKRFMGRRYFFERPRAGETIRDLISKQILWMEPTWLEVSKDGRHVKLTDYGVTEANRFKEPVFTMKSVYEELTSQFA